MSAVSYTIPGMIRTMAAVPRVHLANPKKNAEEISALLDIADQNGVSLCVFPELSLTGYTCGDLFMQPSLLQAALEALDKLANRETKTAFIVGLPLDIQGRLYNCAAIVHHHNVYVAAKTHIPDDGGFCERRWFSSGETIRYFDEVPGLHAESFLLPHNQLIDCGEFMLGVEICEDFWVPNPPSAELATRGATIIANLSASNALAGKHASRCEALRAHSARCMCGYVYASAGYGESTTDMVFSGHAGIYENGDLLAENERFLRTSSYAIADIDTERLAYKRRARPSFWQQLAPDDYSPMPAVIPASVSAAPLMRPLSTLPFLPEDHQDEFLLDALNIQATGLIRRMEQIRTQKLVVGVSGGLDSTLALLSAAYAYDLAGWDKRGIVGITMPGFGTGTRTKGNAEKLMELIGCTMLTIPIGPAVTQHFADIGHSADVHDVCYENSQARERTQIIMDYANKIGGLVLGTGDLSEVALGWCTYNGDHMSMYNLNGSVPKTLMRSMVAYAARLLGDNIVPVAQDILDTPVSPELIPGKNGEIAQKTEETLGAYELHDFFLWHMMDAGAGPKKLYAMACQAFDGQHEHAAILAALRTFVRRFFTQQFKRSAMPDGPKVTPVSLSPRGDWHMPSDAQMQLWLDEVDSIA
ncbi:MAG: NAD(+) synthase [Clostridiales bacterium]|nr:NAD(+) synthase [Clostridiales bacterium]